jgi:transposase
MIQLGSYEHVRDDERDELREALKHAYLAGASIRELAEQTGRSYGFCNRLLHEANVTLRPRGGARTRRPKVDATAE